MLFHLIFTLTFIVGNVNTFNNVTAQWHPPLGFGTTHMLPAVNAFLLACLVWHLVPKAGCFLAGADNAIEHQRMPGSLKLLGNGQPLQMCYTAPPVDMLWDYGDRCFASCCGPRVQFQDNWAQWLDLINTKHTGIIFFFSLSLFYKTTLGTRRIQHFAQGWLGKVNTC